eukprot:TRINITY_DN1980_c0_g1::TRINITY_DN1980_c0_g1_i1::g.23091::m.23091 TRINITY_DN1980_c0_g1::TRINITY_DN1980_c0_g1_i1::g.23091  ORF type:complete len:2094 (-),score=598.90,Filamin/PF00630.14/1.8,Filamin/PF00630.14/0.84,Filamin/PF00630.14/0.0022,Filamin/PF00630.14/0.001,Filamin/PF00630.14/1.2e+04,Filamin/PF00630.14/6.2e-06,Filamin/PF00630.14/27,Filamin/PF00630.14/3.6e-06,Filamin/PF00630.14/4.8,Filamin/PF00630.14/12,Filamin/PF00630.14/35,Filamin/PF00630.14/6.3e+02 TRINITY_DN1980_c0_g1_i1:447-6677(-)
MSRLEFPTTTIAAGSNATFSIRAFDRYGNAQTTPDLISFVATVTGSTSLTAVLQLASTSPVIYTGSIFNTVSGIYELAVTWNGTAIQSSGLTFSFVAGAVVASKTQIQELSATSVAGDSYFYVQAYDKYDNLVKENHTISVLFNNISPSSVSTAWLSTSSRYYVRFNITTAGSYGVKVSVSGQTMDDYVPFSVIAGAVSATTSQVTYTAIPTTTGSPISLTLSSRDSYSNLRTSGGSLFVLYVTPVSSTYSLFTQVLTDNLDGTYSASQTVSVTGSYTVVVRRGTTLVPSSSLTITVAPGSAVAANSVVTPVTTGVAGVSSSFSISTADQYNNLADASSTSSISIQVSPSPLAAPAVTRTSIGQYSVAYTPTVATQHTVTVYLLGSVLSSFSQSVSAGPVSGSRSILAFTASTVAPGSVVQATLSARDAYNNVATFSSGDIVTSTLTLVSTSAMTPSTSVVVSGSSAIIRFSPTAVGTYSAVASINGTAGSSVNLFVQSSSASASVSSVTGTTSVTAGSPTTFTILLRDSYNNPVGYSLVSSSVAISISAPSSSTNSTSSVAVSYALDTSASADGSTVRVSYTPTLATAHSVFVRIDGLSIAGLAPVLQVQVSPASTNPASCIVTAPTSTYADQVMTATVQTYDQFGNLRTNTDDSASLAATLTISSRTSSATVSMISPGYYSVTVTPATTGSGILFVSYNSVGLGSSSGNFPVTVSQAAGSVSAAYSYISTKSGSSFTAGGAYAFTVVAVNEFGQPLYNKNTKFATRMLDAAGNALTNGNSLTIVDNGDTTYSIAGLYITLSGTYKLEVTLKNVQVANSPYTFILAPTVTGTPSLIRHTNSSVNTLSAVAGQSFNMLINAYDTFGNQQMYTGTQDAFTVNFTKGSSDVKGSVASNGNSPLTYAVLASITQTGLYTVTSTLNSRAIGNSGLIYVNVLPANASMSYSYAPQLDSVVAAGTAVSVSVIVYDIYNNSYTLNDASVSVSTTGTRVFLTSTLSNGVYTGSLNLTSTGSYSLNFTVNDQTCIGCAGKVTVVAGTPVATTSVLNIPSYGWYADKAATFSVDARDAYGNVANFSSLCNSSNVFVAFSQNSSFTYASHTSCDTTAVFSVTPALSGTNLVTLVVGTSTRNTSVTVVPASAPRASATTDSLVSVLYLTFDQDTNAIAGAAPACTAIFTSASVDLLGTDVTCRWSSPSKLIVSLGSSPTFVFGDKLSFQQNVIYNSRLSSYAVTGTVSIVAPSDLVALTLDLNGPTTCNLYYGLEVYSTLSGSLNLPIDYTWTLGSSSASTTGAMSLLSAASTNEEDSVTLDTSSLVVGTWNFTLRATRKLDGSTVIQSKTVKVTEGSYIDIIRIGPASRTLSLTQRNTIVLETDVRTDSRIISLVWIQTYGPSVELPVTSEPRQILPPTTLSPGNQYVFRATVSSASASASCEFNITTVLSSVSASISGGGFKSVFSEIELFAAGDDPDYLSEPFTYLWTCTSSSSSPCFTSPSGLLGVTTSSNSLSLPAYTLAVGTYSFGVTVTKDAGGSIRSASTLIEVVVQQNASINPNVTFSINVEDAGNVFSYSEELHPVISSMRLVLEGNSSVACDSTVKNCRWYSCQSSSDCSSGPLNLDDPSIVLSNNYYGANLVSLRLQSDVLNPGQTYYFRLEVTDLSTGRVGRQTQAVPVRNGPRLGTFSITPKANLRALDSFVTLRLNKWDSESLPLLYSFMIYTSSGTEYIIQDGSGSESLRFVLPPEAVQVSALIRDAAGAVTSVDLPISVTCDDINTNNMITLNTDLIMEQKYYSSNVLSNLIIAASMNGCNAPTTSRRLLGLTPAEDYEEAKQIAKKFYPSLFAQTQTDSAPNNALPNLLVELAHLPELPAQEVLALAQVLDSVTKREIAPSHVSDLLDTAGALFSQSSVQSCGDSVVSKALDLLHISTKRITDYLENQSLALGDSISLHTDHAQVMVYRSKGSSVLGLRDGTALRFAVPENAISTSSMLKWMQDTRPCSQVQSDSVLRPQQVVKYNALASSSHYVMFPVENEVRQQQATCLGYDSASDVWSSHVCSTFRTTMSGSVICRCTPSITEIALA